MDGCVFIFFFAPKKNPLQEITIPGARARREGEKVQLCFDTQPLGSTSTLPPTGHGGVNGQPWCHISGKIIATSHDLTPNSGLVGEIPLFQGNLGW